MSCVVPTVCKFGFENYETKKEDLKTRHFAECKFCKQKTTITDCVPTITNFVRHLKRKHPNE